MKVAILLSHHQAGNSLRSFQLLLQVCKSVFSQVDLVTFGGKAAVFVDTNGTKADQGESWEYADYVAVDLIQNDYQGLVVPDGMGHYHHTDDPQCRAALGDFIYSFVKFK
ncbi:hypothetical protein HDU91_002388, partial [Kappamyces sp. JEL0680]